MKPIRTKKQVKDFFAKVEREYPPQIEVAFLLQDMSDAYNVGGLIRVADGLGAARIYASGKTPQPDDSPMIPVTSLGHHRRIPFEYHKVHEEAAKKAISDGWTLVALEVDEDAECCFDFDYPERVCFVLGNEQTGIYPSVYKHCDHAVYIPMYGKGRSLNVHVAAAIAAFDAVVRKRS
jgi:tRNA (guanosine-2'-O-)-methyltransferase